MSIEGSGSGKNLVVSDVDNFQPESLDNYKEEIKKLQKEIEWLKEKNIGVPKRGNFVGSENETLQIEDNEREIREDPRCNLLPCWCSMNVVRNEDAQSTTLLTLDKYADKHKDAWFNPANANSAFENIENEPEHNVGKQEDSRLDAKSDSANDEETQKMGSPFYFALGNP